MENTITDRDFLHHAICRISFLAHLFCSVSEDSFHPSENDMFGFIHILWDIQSLLESAEEDFNAVGRPLLDSLKLTERLLKEGAFRPDGAVKEAKEAIKEIDQFMDNDLAQITALRNEFKNIAKYYDRCLESEKETES